MTAGAGVVPSEMPEHEFFRTGSMHGFQLWVNLPKREKMMRPPYQEIPREGIPTELSPDGRSECGSLPAKPWEQKPLSIRGPPSCCSTSRSRQGHGCDSAGAAQLHCVRLRKMRQIAART
jgi:hypothetical protein